MIRKLVGFVLLATVVHAVRSGNVWYPAVLCGFVSGFLFGLWSVPQSETVPPKGVCWFLAVNVYAGIFLTVLRAGARPEPWYLPALLGFVNGILFAVYEKRFSLTREQ